MGSMKIGLIADIHINCKDDMLWEVDRLQELTVTINKLDIEELWILGDLIDKSKPTVDDITTTYAFLKDIKHTIKYIDGNHERVNKQKYILEPLMDMWGYEKLPLEQTIKGHKIVSVGHSDLHELIDIDNGSLLLSHFRWTHPLYGHGELHSIERELTKKFTNVILGDIHFRYTPLKNVKYISSPYANRYSTTQEHGMMVIDITTKGIQQEYIDSDLPTKIKLTTTLGKLPKLIETLDAQHKYTINVKIINRKELKTFNRVSLPSNVVNLRPVLSRIKQETAEVVVKESVLDTLIDVLPKNLSNDLDYIKGILEN